MNTLIVTLATTWATDGPKPEDVKAGWTAFAVFLLLLVAVALLGWSLSRQLKRAERNKEAGILPSSKDKQKQHHAPQA
jgi:nitric oxide reductase large subunit